MESVTGLMLDRRAFPDILSNFWKYGLCCAGDKCQSDGNEVALEAVE